MDSCFRIVGIAGEKLSFSVIAFTQPDYNYHIACTVFTVYLQQHSHCRPEMHRICLIWGLWKHIYATYGENMPW